VLNQLFYLAADENSYKQVNAIVNSKLNEIAALLKAKKTNDVQKIYELELIKSIEIFKKDPSKFVKPTVLKIPDGSPIGME